MGTESGAGQYCSAYPIVKVPLGTTLRFKIEDIYDIYTFDTLDGILDFSPSSPKPICNFEKNTAHEYANSIGVYDYEINKCGRHYFSTSFQGICTNDGALLIIDACDTTSDRSSGGMKYQLSRGLGVSILFQLY